MRDEVIKAPLTVLDYGCGRGQDAARLRKMGLDAHGWDPHFAPDTPLTERDVVLMTYVLNVIENPTERKETIRKAWNLTSKVLIVSSRLAWELNAVRGRETGDGIISSRNTFQHFFTPGEIRCAVEEVTDRRCVSPVPGVVYAFRRDEDRFAYLARGAIAEFEWTASEDYASAVAEIVSFAEKRGRPPLFEEIPDELLPQLGTLSRRSLLEIVNRGVAPERAAEGFRRTTLDTLLYLGTSIFNGRAAFVDLPLGVQADIKRCFKSYREACARADRLLAKIRDDTYIRGAMQNSPGKMTATALYVHRRAVPGIPVVLKLYEHCGFIAAGRPDGWNIVKLDHRGRRVSWSSYPDFDTNPHPTLDWTYGVDMKSLDAGYQSFGGRANRPLLHRKEEFLAPDDPAVEKYRRLTAAEVRAGLYANPTVIGLENGWAGELERCGVALRGHRLVKQQRSPDSCSKLVDVERTRTTMSNECREALNRAQGLADSMRSLAVEYQELVRSTASGSDAATPTARRSVDRKFQKLRPRASIDELRELGLPEVARRLDDLWKAAAMVFNLVAVSVGVDEAEVLDIDIEGPYAAAMDVLKGL